MRNATVKIRGYDNRIYDVTKSLAHFKILLPAGDYVIEVNSHLYATYIEEIKVTHGNMTYVNVILKKQTLLTHNGLTNDQNDGTSGIEGYVKDNNDHPVGGALVTVVELNVTLKTDSSGAYSINLMPGRYTIKVTADGYTSNVKILTVDYLNKAQIVMFTLIKDSNIWGMPRLVFVIFTGIACFVSLGCGIFILLKCRTRKNSDYGPVAQDFCEEYRDFDESKETELFTRPLTGMSKRRLSKTNKFCFR